MMHVFFTKLIIGGRGALGGWPLNICYKNCVPHSKTVVNDSFTRQKKLIPPKIFFFGPLL